MFNFYLDLSFNPKPFKNVIRLGSLIFIKADKMPLKSLFKTSPSKNHSGWKKSF